GGAARRAGGAAAGPCPRARARRGRLSLRRAPARPHGDVGHALRAAHPAAFRPPLRLRLDRHRADPLRPRAMDGGDRRVGGAARAHHRGDRDDDGRDDEPRDARAHRASDSGLRPHRGGVLGDGGGGLRPDGGACGAAGAHPHHVDGLGDLLRLGAPALPPARLEAAHHAAPRRPSRLSPTGGGGGPLRPPPCPKRSRSLPRSPRRRRRRLGLSGSASMNRSEQPPSLFGPAHRTLTLGVIGAVSLVGFEAMAVATILPTAARELDGLSAYGWAFAAFMLANLVGTMGAGELADARGPRLPLLLAAAAMALGLGIGTFAPSWEILLVGRAFQGLGGGALLTLGYLAIRRGYPEAVRPRMLAVVSSSWILPSLLGPVAAGALAERASWRLAFALLVPLWLAPLALLFPAPGRLPPVAGRPALGRTGRTALLALCRGLFLASLQLRTLWTLPGALLAGTLALLFARSILPAGTLRLARGLPAGLVFRSLLSFAFFGAEAFVPLGLSTLRGFSPTAGGL